MGFIQCKAELPLQGMELQEKEEEKEEKHISCEKEPKGKKCPLSLAFCRQKVAGSTCARKETVDIDILLIFRNGDRKIIQPLRIMSGHSTRIMKWNQFSQFR